MRRRRLAYSLATALVLLIVGSAQAQTQQITVRHGSTLQIDGTSSVNAFTCVAETVDGHGRLATTPARLASTERRQPQAELTVPVHALDCGKDRMNEDLYEAIGASEHPTIRYRLDEADLLERVGEDTYRLRTRGWLSLAGEERPIEMTVVGKRIGDGQYAVQGSKTLLMSDFGIDPPSALLGLIKAHDRIEVHFDLVAECMANIAANYAPCE
ncbi:MAG: YceI family protein [Bacteroidetes bacterium]|jgi:hypothetical protein|nr:YceI family protein [Bacteroidota bacterium]